MIVLDYLKEFANLDMAIIVPPFHTGHLGFIPGTEVQVGVMAPFTERLTHCEIVISPFQQQDVRQMARILCTMRDDIGVVGRLVKAVSRLGINIVTEESSSINHLDYHTVNLLVDMSNAPLNMLKAGMTNPRVIGLYGRYESLFPLHDNRFVILFDTIIAYCADVIVWKDVLGRSMPQLTIEPLSANKLANNPSSARVLNVPKRPYHVQIKIPEASAQFVRTRLRHDGVSKLKYVLLSDTDERTLRVFFPTDKIVGCLVHVAFYHDDLPGVLSEITDAVAHAGFSILTSLLRKRTVSQNVWEAVLQYKGDGDIPLGRIPQDICEWVVRLIVEKSSNVAVLEEYKVSVGLPLYPKKSKGWDDVIKIVGKGTRVYSEALDTVALLDKRAIDLSSEAIDANQRSAALGLVSLVRRKIAKDSRQKIFLSYPSMAKQHAKLLSDKLGPYFDLDRYQEPDGEVILSSVLSKIHDSDYFIGIWQHDESLPTSNVKYAISPWMPFEYGVAFSAGKPSIVIHSDKLDDRIWKRINPGVATPEYSDLYFESIMVELVYNFCMSNWDGKKMN